jgi:hypothetical protein
MLNWTVSSQLQTLNLSSNLLTGALDSSWATLRVPVSVDVSHNNLTGPLPTAWGAEGLDGASMQLVLLNASHNALTGEMPSAGLLECSVPEVACTLMG